MFNHIKSETLRSIVNMRFVNMEPILSYQKSFLHNLKSSSISTHFLIY